jgi:hypothetical protein
MVAGSATTANTSAAASNAALDRAPAVVPDADAATRGPLLPVAVVASKDSSVQAASSAAWPAPDVEDIPPRPIKRHHISDEIAEMLATLPRNKWDDPTSAAALGGAAASLPSAVDALISAVQRQPFSLQLFESIQVAIFLCFAVWFLARKRSKKGKTSADLLEELRNREPTSADRGALVP